MRKQSKTGPGGLGICGRGRAGLSPVRAWVVARAVRADLYPSGKSGPWAGSRPIGRAGDSPRLISRWKSPKRASSTASSSRSRYRWALCYLRAVTEQLLLFQVLAPFCDAVRFVPVPAVTPPGLVWERLCGNARVSAPRTEKEFVWPPRPLPAVTPAAPRRSS